MDKNSLVSFASEQTPGWLAIWRFFALVVLAIFAAMIAASQHAKSSLPTVRVAAMIAFCVYAAMHLVTLIRYFKVYETLEKMLDRNATDERELMRWLAPPLEDKWVVILLYGIFVGIVMVFLLSFDGGLEGSCKNDYIGCSMVGSLTDWVLMGGVCLVLSIMLVFGLSWLVERRYK